MLDRGADCGCVSTVSAGVLELDAADCPNDGALATAPDCRETAVTACRRPGVDAIRVRARGFERRYGDRAVALLAAAGRFAARLDRECPALGDGADPIAPLVRRDPLAGAAEATARAAPLPEWAGETGLADAANDLAGYDAFVVREGPAVAPTRIRTRVPVDWTVTETSQLSTGATARRCRDARDRPRYHLEPSWTTLDADGRETLERAYERVAAGPAGTATTRASPGAADGPVGEIESDGSPGTAPTGATPHRRAVAAVSDGVPDPTVVATLRRQTTGDGVLEDLFADPAVSDVFAPSDADGPVLRVGLGEDGSVPTNCRLTAGGASALASSVRAASGRAFSRATPTVDAATTIGGVPVRVAGVREPVAEGVGFAFRRGSADAFTLPELVANDTLPADAAALLSLATTRAAATLVAGARGAGKTTLLGALCFELDPTTRAVFVEDTPELPVDALRADDRDVQGLRTSERGDGVDAADALRTALRLGEGALVVGEVRGAEARVLYEAMRVGASSDAVLGTIHGDGAHDVRERVVEDLGVAASSFAVTDCVVTCRRVRVDGAVERRVATIEEVVGDGEYASFEPLYRLGDGGDLEATGRIARGNSALVASLAGPTADYADVWDALARREAVLADRARRGAFDPGAWHALEPGAWTA
jgi:flagellar protein FlaI